MTWLELWEFFRALPPDSITYSAMTGDHTGRRWTELHYMQASALTLMQEQIRALCLVNGVKSSDAPKTFPWPLPDLRTPEQIAEEEARARRASKFLASVKPPALDPEFERRWREAVEQRRQAAKQAV
ncbi:hypothetical protein OG824_04265 [Streptomyces prunicolor]|uniref:hypothetical protein n=1 Tax=Streptomyces prunicolor TaxID=67348 RepID=UPI00224D67AC|nr:hypothetical protein [Streptomyces prunicolor]MCX5234448.1 hypothetical protein [Streptomyces prunicolor]